MIQIKSKREKEIDVEIERLKQEQEDIKSRKSIQCIRKECTKRTKISKIIAVSEHHYIRPYSCSGGDYWEFSNEYQWICPKCNHWIRVHKRRMDYNDKPTDWTGTGDLFEFMSAHRSHFAEWLDNYDYKDLDEIRKNNKKERYR